jgi:tetratricopeptide (TPR) repeat protein
MATGSTQFRPNDQGQGQLNTTDIAIAREAVTSQLGGFILTDANAVRSIYKFDSPSTASTPAPESMRLFCSTPAETTEKTAPQFDRFKELDLRQAGTTFLLAGKYKDAEAQFGQLLELRKTQRGENHWLVGETYNFLGGACECDGRYADAKAHYLNGADVYEKAFGKNDLSTGMQIQNAARMDIQLKDWKKAAKNSKEALEIYEELNPMKDKAVANQTTQLLKDYAKDLEELGDMSGAQQKRQRQKEIEEAWKGQATEAPRITGPYADIHYKYFPEKKTSENKK